MLDSLLDSLSTIHALGEKALQFIDSGEDPARFLDMLDEYLKQLESWQKENREYLASVSDNTVPITDSERGVLRTSLEEVKILHSKLMERSQGLMNEVHSELGNIN